MANQLRKILVVDDEPEILNVIADSLKARELEAELMTNPRMAESRIQWQKYDAIVTDFRMGRLDGAGLVKAIRGSQVNADTPIFVISGALDKSVILQLRSMDVQGILVKPFRNAELIDRILSCFSVQPVTAIG
jgi:DNA-binding response OmpR family regulator